jgi:hypothetical protein
LQFTELGIEHLKVLEVNECHRRCAPCRKVLESEVTIVWTAPSIGYRSLTGRDR